MYHRRPGDLINILITLSSMCSLQNIVIIISIIIKLLLQYYYVFGIGKFVLKKTVVAFVGIGNIISQNFN